MSTIREGNVLRFGYKLNDIASQFYKVSTPLLFLANLWASSICSQK
jgi:hypothetical protein